MSDGYKLDIINTSNVTGTGRQQGESWYLTKYFAGNLGDGKVNPSWPSQSVRHGSMTVSTVKQRRPRGGHC